MPIMNGYKACERICELYKCLNSLRDFDEILIGDPEEQRNLDEISKIFQENQMENFINDNEHNLLNCSTPEQSSSNISLNCML